MSGTLILSDHQAAVMYIGSASNLYLNGLPNFSNYGWKLLEHCMIGQVEYSVYVIMPNIHGVQSVREPLLINWGTLTWVTFTKKSTFFVSSERQPQLEMK